MSWLLRRLIREGIALRKLTCRRLDLHLDILADVEQVRVSEELEALLLKKADAAMVLRGSHLLTQHSISCEPDPSEALDKLVLRYESNPALRQRLRTEIGQAEFEEENLAWSLDRNATVRAMHARYDLSLIHI